MLTVAGRSNVEGYRGANVDLRRIGLDVEETHHARSLVELDENRDNGQQVFQVGER